MKFQEGNIGTQKRGRLSALLKTNGNWTKLGRAGRQTIYRVVHCIRSKAWVMRLGEVVKGEFIPNKSPTTSEYREEWSSKEINELKAAGRLMHGDERGIPEQMSAANEPEGGDAELDHKRALVDYVLKQWGDSIFEERTSYSIAMKNAADVFGVSEPTARRLLEVHLFYGKHKNALIKQNWNKGPKGQTKRGQAVDALRNPKGSVGRPTSNERTERETIHKTKPVGKRFFDKLERFIWKQAWQNDDDLTVILDRFKDSQVGWNRGDDGFPRSYPKDPKYFPEDDYLRKLARKILKKARSARDRERELARKHWKGMRRSGSAQDLVHEELSVLDIDATPADVHLRFGNDEIYIDGQGKPTVLLAIDRGSAAVVGWHVTFGTEKGDGYKSCVFSAYTPKDRELHRWGMPMLEGMVYGCASQIFIDRGPGISKAAQDAIVDRLRTDSLMAAPGDPQGKGHAEGVMGYFQKELSRLPGSTHGTGNPDEDRRRRLKVKKNAVLTLRHFMQALLVAINKWNLSADVRHLLTSDMLREEKGPRPRPIPFDIYVFNKGRRDGDYAWDWPEEKVFRRLTVSRTLQAPDGYVTLAKRKYTHPDFQALARTYEDTNGEPFEALVFEIPSAPLHLMWERPDKSLGLLDATGPTQRQFDDDFRWTHDFLSLRRNALKREASYKNREQPTVRNTIDATVVSDATARQMAEVEKHANTAKKSGTATENRRRATAHAEKGYANSLVKVFENKSSTAPKRPDGVELHSAAKPKKKYRSINNKQVLFTDF